MSDTPACLAGFPVVTTLPILWGDEDAFGHVNNLIYLRWCETVRVDYLRRIGLFPVLPPSGLGPIVASIRCDFKLPLNYPDVIFAGARVTRIGNTSFGMEHRIVSRDLNEVAAEADSTLVVLDYGSRRPAPVPPEIRRAIEDLEGRSF